jgi:hypothetical protein
MKMATITSIHDPSFALFPVNNDRTGWRPFGLPVILVVPHRNDRTGQSLTNSQIFNVRVYVENVPKEARVAGHTNIGIRSPDRELYAVDLNSLDLINKAIDPLQYRITRNGIEIEANKAKTGDLIDYVTFTGVKDTMKYIEGANYYDLSEVKIDFEHLPSDQYNLVYQAEYFRRVVSNDGRDEFLCIDLSQTALAILKFNVKHPGEVIEEFERLTPAPYLTNANRSQDTTLELYRPFTDILQDIMDEQKLLASINWVYDVPAEAIPYLSQLLGWDIPYFPESLDNLRRAVLRRTVELQNLSGSRLAIQNIFRLFGFEILISNLWWSSDGYRLIRPGERLPFKYMSEEITILQKSQIDIILSDYDSNKFEELHIPLSFKPQERVGEENYIALRNGGDITIDCYLVVKGSDAYNTLTNISEEIQKDPVNYGDDSGGHRTDKNGFLIPVDISEKMSGKEISGYSQILIRGKLGRAADEVLVGPEIPLKKAGVAFDRDNNRIKLTLNGILNDNFSRTDKVVFAFATYKKEEIQVPDKIANLQSNRFDIQVLTETLAEFADPVFLDFAVEFLFRLKAFHSLLNKIIFRIELNETYEVTDWCVGGDVVQRYDTDAGTLQVPPAIIPDVPTDVNDCGRLNDNNLGYKDSDIILRLRKLANLPEEHAAWKLLDDRVILETMTRLSLMDQADGRESCKYTHKGQDRIIGQRIDKRTTEIGPSPNANGSASGFYSSIQESPIEEADNGRFDTGSKASSNNDSSGYGSFTKEYTEVRIPHCELDNITDYCYKGRVDEELLYRPTIVGDENFIFRQCNISLGTGAYYLYPVYSTMVVKGVKNPCLNSLASHSIFSGGSPTGNRKYYVESANGRYLEADYNKRLQRNSHLSRLLRDYNQPSDYTLHFTNRIGRQNNDARQNLAIQRPSLNIDKPTLHLPGCRFPRMNALKDDFYHPEWTARPWDDDFSTHCGPKYVCGNKEPDFLNCAKIIVGGNEFLLFDNKPFQALGNNLAPDISSLGEHSLGTDATFSTSEVIHKVYMKDANSNEAITFEGVGDYDTSVTNDTILIDRPIFQSHSKCNTGEFIDFAEGYACESGTYAYEGEDVGRGGLFDEIFQALGMPYDSSTDPNILLFLLGDGILSESGLRLDCGCAIVNCDGTDSSETICALSHFIDQDGELDWNPDHIDILSRMKLEETHGIRSMCLDGSIGSLLELV